MASSSVGSVACFVATVLTDEISCQSSFWIRVHWAVTIANRAWRLVAGIRHKDVRQKARLSDEMLAQIGMWIIFTQFPSVDGSKYSEHSSQPGENSKTFICPCDSQLRPGDKVRDTEGIPSFQEISSNKMNK